MINVELFRQLLELGWPALVTLGFVYLARSYMSQVNDEIVYLRKRLDDLEGRQDTVERISLNQKS